MICIRDPDMNTLLAVIGISLVPITNLTYVGESEYLVSTSRGLNPQLTVLSMSKLSTIWSHRLDTEATASSTNSYAFVVLALSKRIRFSDIGLHCEKEIILLFNAEKTVPLSAWFVDKAEGGGEDGVAIDEVLAYVDGAYEYVLLNPHGEHANKLSVSCRQDCHSLEQAYKHEYASLYGELPEFGLKVDEIPVRSMVLEETWKSIFSGLSHNLLPLEKLCSELLESWLERRSGVVKYYTWNSELMSKHGINVPKSVVIGLIDEVRKKALYELFPNQSNVVVKSQILAGGRGLVTFKNGFQWGVKIVEASKVEDVDGKMLGQILVQTGPQGNVVSKVYLVEKLSLVNVMYSAMAETADDQLVAANAKHNFDDNSTFRQKEIFALRDPTQEGPCEVAYIDLDGDDEERTSCT